MFHSRVSGSHPLQTDAPVSSIAALSTKLGEELQFERDNADLAAEPDFLAAFKAEGVWKASSHAALSKSG